MEKLVIIGSGCAGLTAAIYATRALLNPLVIIGNHDGGALTDTMEVENFPGFPEPVSGAEILGNMKKQAKNLGARFQSGMVEKIEKLDDKAGFIIHIKGKDSIQAYSVIIATGATARWLGCKGEDKFRGHGVSVCATCDGFFYKEKKVAVVGGGNTALCDAKYLSKLAEKVYIVYRRGEFRTNFKMVEELKKTPNVELVLESVVEEVKGDDLVKSIIVKNLKSDDTKELEVDGVFVAIGCDPNTKFVDGLINLDDAGFIELKSGTTETSMEGIFACGDCANPKHQQAVIAAGHGAEAAIACEHFIMERWPN